MQKFKSGFVAIVGKPNVGKSTLMNKIIGEELSIVTPKAQTTRHRIRGIANGENYQVVFSDTPGILKPVYKLHKRMMHFVDAAFADTDVVLLVIDAGEKRKDEEILARLKKSKLPLVIVINKIDLINEEELAAKVEYWNKELNPVAVIPVSAQENFGVDVLVKNLVALLPEAPAYFEKDQLSDRNDRFFISEIIREQILLQFKQEIPYSVEIGLEEYKEEKDIVRIRSDIFVARNSQKAILLGHKGEAIKKLGTAARIKIEKLLKKKVFLALTIKVRDDWRNDDLMLNRFGYGE